MPMKLPRCVKCGKVLRAERDQNDWDVSGSSHRYICRECAEEEGLELEEDEDGKA